MNLYNIMTRCPIGATLSLSDDDPGTVREVHGYEWFGGTGNIIFKDGSKLNMERLELIVEVAVA